MRLKLYNLLVNKQPGIKIRYHQMHDRSTGKKKLLSWFYLLWLNFAYYILFCKFLGRVPAIEIYEEVELKTDQPESLNSLKMELFLEKLSSYDTISFDIFDTLIFRPFSEPTDLFYFIGEKLVYKDFKRIRTKVEQETRINKHNCAGTYEVTLKEIWESLEEKTGIPASKGIQIEEECELAFCYANPFMQEVYNRLLGMGKRIIIISDMYLSKEFLIKMLAKNGYQGYEKIYISCEHNQNKGSGKLFELVKKECALENGSVIHVGDNENSDINRAKKAGFEALYYPNVNKNSSLYRPYDMSPMIGGAYRGLVNTHLNCGVFSHSMEYEYGYIYGGLFVVGYCAFIHDYCQKNGIDKILFLSRDGDILSQVYPMLYPEEQIEYVFWSRKVATKLMAKYDRFDYFRRFLDHKINQNILMEDIFKSMEMENLFLKLPEKLKKATLTSENVKNVNVFLLEHWDEVLAAYDREHQAAKQYYAKVLKDCKKVAAVDIGWAGSGAIALDCLVNRAWHLNCEVIGLLAGTNTVHNYEPDESETFLQTGKLVAYLYSLAHNRDLVKKHDLNKDYNVFWELLLSSPQSQFVGFDFKGDKLAFRFGKKDANQEGILEVQKGILQFAEEYIEHFGEYKFMLNISGRDAYAPMLIAASKNEKYLKSMKNRFNLVVGVE